jgi:hypothetical protein
MLLLQCFLKAAFGSTALPIAGRLVNWRTFGTFVLGVCPHQQKFRKMPHFNIVRIPKYRKYDYQPRYYDADKEEREARRKYRSGEASNDPEAVKARISNSFRRGLKLRDEGSHARAGQVARLRLLIMLGLAIASYFFVLYFLPMLIEKMGL